MKAHPRIATDLEAERIWPAVQAARLFDGRERYLEFRARAPWRVRVTESGSAMVLETWREHLDVLAIRGLWCPQRHTRSFVDDARSVARAQGYGRVMSPLVPEYMLGSYLRSGMQPLETVVALQALTGTIAELDPPPGVTIRLATDQDLPSVLVLDGASFADFWRYGLPELTTNLAEERMAVADESGQVVGYTLCTVSRGAATFGRLAVSPDHRHRGIGAALVSDAASYARRAGAETFALCTQEDNVASRSLYARVGLHELAERYVFAVCDAS